MWSLNSEQHRVPIYEMLQHYILNNAVRFHMPGHKGKACDDMASWLAQNMWSIDVTELPDTDNLHMPQGPIAQAQQLMAEAVGADESFLW